MGNKENQKLINNMKIQDLLPTNNVSVHTEPGLYLVSGCWHMPFHNVKLAKAYINLMKDLYKTGQLKGHFLIGDILDMHSISRHAKGKITVPGLTLSKEYQEANKVLNAFDKAAPGIKKEFFWGNHEHWYKVHMSSVDAAKLGTGVVKSPSEGLYLNERGYVVQEDMNTSEIILGDLSLMHGQWTNIHAAHKHLTMLKKNVAFVHTHRMGVYSEANIAAYNIGWMGQKEYPVFNYMSKFQKDTWRNGFAVIYLDKDGRSHVNQIDWKNDKFIYNGKEYK